MKKKVISSILTAVLAVSLAGCGKDENVSVVKAENSEATTSGEVIELTNGFPFSIIIDLQVVYILIIS